LAPRGYHVPSDVEWITLTTFLGGVNIAGGKMKHTGTLYWASPNGLANNSSGFTGLPGGFRNDIGTFYGVGVDANKNGFLWSSSERFNTSAVWVRGLNYANGSVYSNTFSMGDGLSVRCIKD